MGYRFSWISVAAKAGADVLSELGLTDSAQSVEAGTVPMSGARLANGSYVIVFNEFFHPMIDPLLMKVLSLNCIVVGCTEDDNTNASMAFLCRDGARVWTVSHVLAEGADHLSIEGVPPKAVASLRHAALKARSEYGHDAVFSVPAALAEEVCGFRHGERNGLLFTRLDRKFADIDATLNEIVRMAADMLEAGGYVQDASRPYLFVKTTAADRIKVYLRHSTTPEIGAMHFDARVEVCNNYVHGFMHQASDLHATETAVLQLSDALNALGALATPAKVAACLSQLQSEFPAWLGRLHDIVALEALVNDSRPRYNAMGEVTQCRYDGDTGYSRLILAYLASNPRFEEMVVQTDLVLSRGNRDPESDLNKICSHLRAHVKPLVRANAAGLR